MGVHASCLMEERKLVQYLLPAVMVAELASRTLSLNAYPYPAQVVRQLSGEPGKQPEGRWR